MLAHANHATGRISSPKSDYAILSLTIVQPARPPKKDKHLVPRDESHEDVEQPTSRPVLEEAEELDELAPVQLAKDDEDREQDAVDAEQDAASWRGDNKRIARRERCEATKTRRASKLEGATGMLRASLGMWYSRAAYGNTLPARYPVSEPPPVPCLSEACSHVYCCAALCEGALL